MSGVNVLNAMRVAEAYCYEAGAANAARNIKEARAAVVELVEAANAMNELARGPVDGVSLQQKREAATRMDAAVARIVGAK